MGKLSDLTGKKMGQLLVIKRVENDANGNTYWLCRCDCDNFCTMRSSALRTQRVLRGVNCGRTLCRFWAHVNKNGPVQAHCPELEECWEWTGAVEDTGYGVLRGDNGKNVRVHIYSYQLHMGHPPQHWVLHRCDNRKCIRPSHLFVGTRQDNVTDMVKKGRQGAWRAPLDPAIRGRIRQEYFGAPGAPPQHALAQKYGIDLSTVRRILRETPT